MCKCVFVTHFFQDTCLLASFTICQKKDFSLTHAVVHPSPQPLLCALVYKKGMMMI